MCCMLQVFHPDKFQAHVLGQRGEDTVVQAPKQLAFTDFYMPATAELTKDVFAEEATGTITQGLAQEGGYTAFGELCWGACGQLSCFAGQPWRRTSCISTLTEHAMLC